MLGGRTDGRRNSSSPTPVASAAPGRQPRPEPPGRRPRRLCPPMEPERPGTWRPGGGGEGPPEAYSHLKSCLPVFGEDSRRLVPTHPPPPVLSNCRPFPLFLWHIFLVCSYFLLIVHLPAPPILVLYFLLFLPGIPGPRSRDWHLPPGTVSVTVGFSVWVV